MNKAHLSLLPSVGSVNFVTSKLPTMCNFAAKISFLNNKCSASPNIPKN